MKIFCYLSLFCLTLIGPILQPERAEASGGAELKPVLYVDVYRSWKEAQMLGVPYRDYAIAEPRVYTLIAQLNRAYGDYLTFKVGRISAVSARELYYTTRSCSETLANFRKTEPLNPDRISVLVMHMSDDSQFGCARPIPRGEKPALALAMNLSDVPIYNGTNLAPTGAFILIHEMGHVFGFNHTAITAGAGNAYEAAEMAIKVVACGMHYWHPIFNRDKPRDFTYNGITFRYDDWHGASNVMSSFNREFLLDIQNVGLFRSGYKAVFEKQLQCW